MRSGVLSLANCSVERAHGLLQRSLGIEPVGVEDVDVVETHPPETGVETGQEVLARPAVTVGTRPHVVPRLGGDDQLIAVLGEGPVDHRAEVGLRRPVGRPVVVGQVEMRDPQVERSGQHGVDLLWRSRVTEVLPQTERDQGELEAGSPTSSVLHVLVAFIGGEMSHLTNVDQSIGPGAGPMDWIRGCVAHATWPKVVGVPDRHRATPDCMTRPIHLAS
jgi:hypothetical protein